jgi:uncharacterized protein YggE
VKRVGLLAVLVLAACGAAKSYSAADVRACIPHGAYTRMLVTREEGVTSINYYYADGSEADISVFRSAHDAEDAEKQEARLGDAHDRRRANVLYSGGGPVQAALEKCLR